MMELDSVTISSGLLVPNTRKTGISWLFAIDIPPDSMRPSMIDVENYDVIEMLRNGTAVNIRSVRTDDKNRLTEAFRNLEAESIYTRFFGHKKELSEDELRRATEVDFENVVALVVTIVKDGIETIIGGGRYSVIDPEESQRCAELAFTVEEDYHGLGIAGRLMHHLTRIARERGLHRFEADVLSANRAMLKFFSRCNLPMKTTFEGEVMHVTLSLA